MQEASFAARRPRCSASRRLPGKVGFSAHQRNGRHGGVWEVRYQTRQEQCLEMLDTWRDQVPHGWVTGDDELGRHMRFRYELCERGERYVLGVPCNTIIRDLEAPLPAYAGRGRPPKAPWHSVTQWRQGLDAETWTHLTVRDGEKGPIEIEIDQSCN